MNIKFIGVESEKIKNCFLKAAKAYETLYEYEIILNQRHIKSSTMQAQPVIKLSRVFKGINAYQINLANYVRDSKSVKVADLPEEILTGWFAHELGHVVDYGDKSTIGMLIYGVKYVLSGKFKREVEHEADRIAISHGFVNEILTTKRFILESDFMGKSYKDKINKFYMSIADVELCIDQDQPVEAPKIEL